MKLEASASMWTQTKQITYVLNAKEPSLLKMVVF